MEPDEDGKKKLNDDVVVFMSKRSETEAPRYTARLKTYVDFHQKRRRAAAARRHSEHAREKLTASNRKPDAEQNEKSADRGQPSEKFGHRSRSGSRSGTPDDPSDRCCRRRRRRRRRRSCRRRRRRRSRRRRRRRSCRRRRRRRRRSCSRRRRRRSCRRRRRRRRRRRC